MKDFQKNIDKLVSKILNEEIETKLKRIIETKGQWMEVDVDEEAETEEGNAFTGALAKAKKSGRNSFEVDGKEYDVNESEPKGKMTAADFKKLRDAKSHKEEVEEYYTYNDSIEDAEELSQDEPTYVGKGLMDNKIKNKIQNKMFGSFDDEHGWFDQDDRQHSGDFDFDYEEEEFDDFPSFIERHGDNQRWFDPKGGEGMFNKYKENFGDKPFRVRMVKDLDEEMGEGNAFTGALAKAKKSGKDSFRVDGKEYDVNEGKNTLSLTEDELIDMIENIVKEQIIKDIAEKNTFNMNKPQGLKKTEKTQGDSKKENDNYAKDVVKKMKDYMKDMYMGGKGYDENPDDFPQSNYDMEKEHNEMKYHPSEAVEEYIEAFAYPGMTNLVYDEIKPDDEMITKQIKGDTKNGNAVTGKDGKALGNVSKRSEKTGERFKKNFDDNLYGAEQMEVSYNRQPQPVDVAGSKKQAGSLKSIKSTSKGKADKIMSQLESVESKTTKVINEDLQKMKNLISYNRKTQ
jgi:hypothetical protein